MAKPQGPLTYWQLEVMEVVWELGTATAPEIWEHLAEERDVARTTILTQVQRLEARGWLKRKPRLTPVTFRPTIEREEALGREAEEFLDSHFEGSAAALVQNLLGSGKLERGEVKRLRELLDTTKRRKR